jgi:hypothetical protein
MTFPKVVFLSILLTFYINNKSYILGLQFRVSYLAVKLLVYWCVGNQKLNIKKDIFKIHLLEDSSPLNLQKKLSQYVSGTHLNQQSKDTLKLKVSYDFILIRCHVGFVIFRYKLIIILNK